MTLDVLVINGANLDMLGVRQVDIYGSQTLPEINANLVAFGEERGLVVECYHSNIEGDIINKINSSLHARFIIINAGGFTHTSVAIRDSLLCNGAPFCEVHLSNIYSRESFRKVSLLSDIALGVICGFGELSYMLALQVAVNHLS